MSMTLKQYNLLRDKKESDFCRNIKNVIALSSSKSPDADLKYAESMAKIKDMVWEDNMHVVLQYIYEHPEDLVIKHEWQEHVLYNLSVLRWFINNVIWIDGED